MKKSILLILLGFIMFFSTTNDTFANECSAGDEECIIEGLTGLMYRSYPLCVYEVTQKNDDIYYSAIVVDNNGKFGAISNINITDAQVWGFTNDKNSKDDVGFLLGDNVYEDLINNGKCPQKSYIDDNSNDELCFDNGKEECKNGGNRLNSGTNFNDTETSKLVLNNLGILKKYNEVKNIGFVNACDSENKPLGYSVCRYDSSYGDDIILYYNGNANFVSYYNSDLGGRYFASPNTSHYFSHGMETTKVGLPKSFHNKINATISSCPQILYMYKTDKTNTIDLRVDREHYFLYTQEQNIDYEDIEIFDLVKCSPEIEKPSEPLTDCEGLISGKLREYINGLLDIIKIGVPILLIGLIVYDFATAVFAGSDDKVTKAKNRAIKRVIIAIIIFFVPTLINFVFDLVNEVWGTKFEICETTEIK